MVNTIIYVTRRIVFIIILFICHGQRNYLCHTSYCVYNELIIYYLYVMVNAIIYVTRRIVLLMSRLFIICMSWSIQLFMSHVVLCL